MFCFLISDYFDWFEFPFLENTQGAMFALKIWRPPLRDVSVRLLRHGLLECVLPVLGAIPAWPACTEGWCYYNIACEFLRDQKQTPQTQCEDRKRHGSLHPMFNVVLQKSYLILSAFLRFDAS